MDVVNKVNSTFQIVNRHTKESGCVETDDECLTKIGTIAETLGNIICQYFVLSHSPLYISFNLLGIFNIVLPT